jgi:hypothetical protein
MSGFGFAFGFGFRFAFASTLRKVSGSASLEEK